MTNIKAIRGMQDIPPAQVGEWQYVEAVIRDLMAAYGYQELRFPILESTALFSRSVGEETDIVSKEMYTFLDRNGESITLRPEGTAPCVRASLEQGLLFKQTQRLWYLGPMFRHERPQKGRLRQFHQLGVEAFGLVGPDIDAEIIAISARLWRMLGVDGHVRLQINSLGNAESRAQHREKLVEYLNKNLDILDEDSKRRLTTNPLRILDSKNPALRDMIEQAPRLLDFLDSQAQAHFVQLQQLLQALEIAYEVNPHLVRGLDYYTNTVFEWVTDELGAQGTVCAGGRYDGLVEQLGGEPTPSIGFALGLERLISLMQAAGSTISQQTVEVYFVLLDESAVQLGLVLAEKLRNQLPGLRLLMNAGAGSAKSQFKRADKSGARYALILGEDEVAQSVVSVKDLRGEVNLRLSHTQLVEFLAEHLKKGEA